MLASESFQCRLVTKNENMVQMLKLLHDLDHLKEEGAAVEPHI